MLNVDTKAWHPYREFWQAAMAELTEPRWAEATAHAFSLFFGEPADLAETPDASAMMRFYEWFLWDYSLEDGKSICDQIQTQLQQQLGHGIWKQWKWLPVRVVQVREVGVFANGTEKTQLVDLLTGEDLVARVIGGKMATGDILLGRWWSDGEQYLPTPSLRDVPDEVFLFLQKALENIWSGFPGSLTDFLREYGAFFEHWLNDRIGFDWRRSNLLYQVHDFRAVLKRLRQTDGVVRADDRVVPLRGPIFFHWEQDPSLQFVVDDEELLAVGGNRESLTSAKVLLHYSLEGMADLIEENEYGSNPEVIDIDAFGPWTRSRDRKVAELLLRHMASFRHQQIKNALQMWNDFVTQENPNFRRPENWAAAVELAVRQIDADQPRRELLTEKYSVSTEAVNERYRWLKRSLGLVLGDHRYSTL